VCSICRTETLHGERRDRFGERMLPASSSQPVRYPSRTWGRPPSFSPHPSHATAVVFPSVGVASSGSPPSSIARVEERRVHSGQVTQSNERETDKAQQHARAGVTNSREANRSGR
jgi:hypothetical protein